MSHPVKQGLVQMLSVFIDTLLVCSATAMMCLCSGVAPDISMQDGASYVQLALSTVFGSVGPYFITVAMLLFAFTTLLGNLFYCEGCLNYIARRTLPNWQMNVFRVIAALVVFLGAQMELNLVWSIAEVMMGVMVLINLPVLVLLAGPAVRALNDYTAQKRTGRNPVFKAASIGLKQKTDFWN